MALSVCRFVRGSWRVFGGMPWEMSTQPVGFDHPSRGVGKPDGNPAVFWADEPIQSSWSLQVCVCKLAGQWLMQ